MRYVWPLSATAAILFAIFLFVGLERTDYEDGSGYSPFVKQHPTFTLVYRNRATCGECDLRKLENIGKEANLEFNEFCRVRYDLDARLCYAIFADEQRRIDERTGDKSIRSQFHAEHYASALGLPDDAAQELVDFANTRKICDYFRNEMPYPDQRERLLEVAAGIKTFCTGTDRDLARLQEKYGHDAVIAQALTEYEPHVEGDAAP